MEAGVEQERLQQEAELNQKVNEEEVQQNANREEHVISFRFSPAEVLNIHLLPRLEQH